MVNQEVYGFDSADGESKIHARKWIPEGEIKGVLQLVHGMVEYIERYDEFATFMAERGFLVVGHDHIGHGESVASPDRWGMMKGSHPSDIMVADIYSNFELTKKANPNVPYFILGHSMGSYMLRKFLSVKSDSIGGLDGAIIMGTGTVPNVVTAFGLTLISILSVIKGKDSRSELLRDISYDANYKKFDCYGKDFSNSWLSKNVENVEKYYNDDKCTFVFSLNAYKGLIESTRYDNQLKNVQLIRKDLPVLFVSGEDDPVGGMGKGVQVAVDKFKSAGIKDITMKLFKNDRHEILNETDRKEVMEYIYSWIKEKMI